MMEQFCNTNVVFSDVTIFRDTSFLKTLFTSEVGVCNQIILTTLSLSQVC